MICRAPPFTPREADVLRCLMTGQSNKEIARDLGISPGTVKMHLEHIFGKLGVATRLQAVLAAQRSDAA